MLNVPLVKTMARKEYDIAVISGDGIGPELIAEGKNTKEIAFSFNLSVKTIEAHRQRIMDKLNIRSVAALTKYAIREGLTSEDI